jgi:hypothetical protein
MSLEGDSSKDALRIITELLDYDSRRGGSEADISPETKRPPKRAQSASQAPECWPNGTVVELMKRYIVARGRRRAPV